MLLVTVLGYFTVSYMVSNNVWTRIKREHGLYRYNPSGQYFARVRFHGKLYRRKLETDDLAYGEAKTARIQGRSWSAPMPRRATRALQRCWTITRRRSPALTSTKEDKRDVIVKLKATWFGIDSLPLRTIKPSQVTAWLSKHYGDKSASYYNSAFTVIRDALDMAVNDKIMVESPAKGLKYQKRKQPIRRRRHSSSSRSSWPTFARSVSTRMQSRPATSSSFSDWPDSDKLRPRRSNEAMSIWMPGASSFIATRQMMVLSSRSIRNCGRWWKNSAKAKSTTSVCFRSRKLARRWQTRASGSASHFTHRSLRRMFITRAIEKGVDVKAIAEWQGHRDGGKLILATYSHVRPEHSNRMAQLMTTRNRRTSSPCRARHQ